jgi:hypothetical protein
MPDIIPKAFISYSWSSPEHCDVIRSYAERLVGDGVDVILDQWNLSEGQDKYSFMEKMVTDPTVTHVLIFSDAQYAEKADKRKSGVGTESQIISEEVYGKVDQNKFIPLVCGWQENEEQEPCLPIFLKSRKWIDFSTPEQINANWEQLLRVLHGKPQYVKPELGKPPVYIVEDNNRPSLPTIGKFNSLREALMQSKQAVQLYRDDFLNSVIDYTDSLRVRESLGKNIESIEERVLNDFHSLLPLRDQIVDWLLLEMALPDAGKKGDLLVNFLERILSLKSRPSEISSWNDSWFDAHGLFAYELFIYFIAVLIRVDCSPLVRELTSANYMSLDSPPGRELVRFDDFWGYSSLLQERSRRLQKNRLDAVADIIRERATRKDIPFLEIMQAELIIFLCAALETRKWYPHTLVFASHYTPRFPLFVRAVSRKGFERIQVMTGIASATELRERLSQANKSLGMAGWNSGFMCDFYGFLRQALNLDALDTIA